MPPEGFEVGGARLALSRPDTANPPALVAVPAVDDGPLVEHLHAVLPQAGIAVASFASRSPGPADHDAISAVVHHLREMRSVDVDHVGVWGWSDGARIAATTAARDPSVAFAVLVSPSAVTPARRLAYSTARALRELGYDDATVRRISAVRRRLDDAFRRGDTASVRVTLDAVRDEPWFADAALPNVDDAAWARTMDQDLRPEIARLSVPVLLTYGANDRRLPVDESLDVWRRTYRGPRLEVVRLARTGHVPTLADDPEEPGEISTEYERAVLSFLARATG